MKKTVYKKLGISIIASTLLASQLSTVSALSVISSTGEEYEVSETLEKVQGLMILHYPYSTSAMVLSKYYGVADGMNVEGREVRILLKIMC